MTTQQIDIDGHVLQALGAHTGRGVPAVMPPARISRHIGAWITRTGWGPGPQAVTAALKRLERDGKVVRAARPGTWQINEGGE